MELEDFEILCDTLLVNNSELKRISILELLANEQLLSLIKNEKILHKISRKSYIHNNGFIKIVLIDKRPHYAIRLHIWPNTEINNASAHNHPWDITVKIISGEYEWINCSIYNLGNKNALLYNCIYYNNYNSHKIIFLKNVKLNQDEIISYKKGDIFDYSKNIYHTIKKINKIT
ncbi:hypothetical protein [Acinetobacter sp. ANC 5414]|uniref:hypothetical protein n=1 Tax=Acinetobacter sp. ANC 5414 TaxID=2731251 RepID=UPI00148F5BDA|nr:hypothetical protein [Acinetobacter sp. ANC 5414]NNH00960.1 hypothetical protein [Acinetobacter sp. ANC 5414]